MKRTRQRSSLMCIAGTLGVVLLGAFSFACDKVYADPITSPVPSPTAIDSGLSSTSLPPVACPHSVFENGPCSHPDAVCESGTSADPQCNSTFVCRDDPQDGPYWTEQAGPKCAGTCPDPSTIVNNAPCEITGGDQQTVSGDDGGAGDGSVIPAVDPSDPSLELQCPGIESICACTTGADGAHAHPRMWVCVRPQDKDDGCIPDRRPLFGEPCVGDHTCDYGACEFKRGTQMKCEDDVWQIEAATCN